MDERKAVCKVYKLREDMEREPIQRPVPALYLPKLYKHSQEDRRREWICTAVTEAVLFIGRVTVGLLAGVLTSFWVIPAAYAERGYSAVGGEWLLIIGAGLAVVYGIEWLMENN